MKKIIFLLSLLWFLNLFSSPVTYGAPVISIEGNQVSMKNDLGCRLDFFYGDGRYGMGTFYVNDVALGKPIPYFLIEDNIWETSRNTHQTLWPGTWYPYMQADTFEILTNNEKKGVIRFKGRMGKLSGTVTITLDQESTGYKIDYAIIVLETLKHGLYASGPFMPEKMQFVQFPFETPLTPPFTGHWSITPTLSMVPFMFGCEKVGEKNYYVGVGYQLEKDSYQKGKLKYDAQKAEPFQVHFISPYSSGWYGAGWRHPRDTLKLHMVISTAGSQYDCVKGYRLMSGFDVSTPIRRTLDDALTSLYTMYEKTTGYVSLPPYKNKAYHHQVVPSTGGPPPTGYGAWINIGINVQLGYQLYRYWQANPTATWARERALNTAGFYMEVQKEDGSVPSLWAPKEKEFRSYHKINNETGYIYCMDRQAVGAYSLYRLYLARKESEKKTDEALKLSALKAMDYIVDKIQKDGVLGRNYNAEGKYDMVPAPNEALIALDYFYAQTGDKKYDQAREVLEKYTYEHHVFKNHWFDWSSDWGGWDGEGEPPWDIDGLNSLSFATYAVYRHMRTGDPKYIEWAETVASWNWLITIPVQFPGFTHVTKGLTREQDHYLTYDIPFRTTMFNDCYPYLSKVTGDRFFIDFYKMLIQTQHAYQHPVGENKLGGAFDIGLWWDDCGAEPSDVLGEEDINYIVEFSSMYLESVTSPNAYRYVGGPDWGVGLDYDLSFHPDFNKEGPYIAASTSRCSGATWDKATGNLTVTLDGKPGTKGILNVKCPETEDPMKSTIVLINGKKADKKVLNYNTMQRILSVDYIHSQPSLKISIGGFR
jgi:hypothetical protein